MKEVVKFKNYVKWYDEDDSPNKTGVSVRKWMERFPYMIKIPLRHAVDLRDVGELTNGKWSAFASTFDDYSFYYFAEETDAMAFKLRYF